jgi:hypothetical protein
MSAENGEPKAPVDRLVILLERIAVALEKLAEITPGTTFSSPPPATTPKDFLQWARLNGLTDTRARKVLWRAGVYSLDMIEKNALLQCYACGEKTAERILAWKESFAK